MNPIPPFDGKGGTTGQVMGQMPQGITGQMNPNMQAQLLQMQMQNPAFQFQMMAQMQQAGMQSAQQNMLFQQQAMSALPTVNAGQPTSQTVAQMQQLAQVTSGSMVAQMNGSIPQITQIPYNSLQIQASMPSSIQQLSQLAQQYPAMTNQGMASQMQTQFQRQMQANFNYPQRAQSTTNQFGNFGKQNKIPGTSKPKRLKKKQNSLPSQPKPQIPVQQQQAPGSNEIISGHINPITPPVQVNVPVAVPPQPVNMYQSESAVIFNMIKALPDDRLDLFIRLFDCRKQKRREERIDMFMNHVLPRMKSTNSSATNFIIFLIEQLKSQQEIIMKLKEPPVPPVFARMKQHKPLYHIIPMVPTSTVEMAPTMKERRADLMAIGTIVSLGDPYPSIAPIVIDKNEVQPMNFGDEDHSYYFVSVGKLQPRFTARFPVPPQHFLTWFIVQFFEKRTPSDVLKDLFLQRGLKLPDGPVTARTEKCQDCSFDAYEAIESILTKGSAKCPKCGADIVISRLAFDAESAVSASPAASEGAEDLELAKLSLADYLCSVSKTASEANPWTEIIFESEGIPRREFSPLTYSNTADYLAALGDMI